MTVLAVVPVKPFGVAKARLAGVLDAATRSQLGKAMAVRTATQAAAAGAEPLILTGDDGVVSWARGNGLQVALETGTGLDAAAGTGRDIALASGRSWLVLHADLPLVAPTDVAAAMAAMPPQGMVIAPAIDGGTNLIGGSGQFGFAYGPGSFHRHLRRATRAGPVAVVARPRLALDLDSPADLLRAEAHPAGAWLTAYR